MSYTSLRKEVSELKKHTQPKSKRQIIITWGISDNLKFYNDLMANPSNKFMKEPNHPFHSYENFLQYHKFNKLEETVLDVNE